MKAIMRLPPQRKQPSLERLLMPVLLNSRLFSFRFLAVRGRGTRQSRGHIHWRHQMKQSCVQVYKGQAAQGTWEKRWRQERKGKLLWGNLLGNLSRNRLANDRTTYGQPLSKLIIQPIVKLIVKPIAKPIVKPYS